jgi:hypothetical protein
MGHRDCGSVDIRGERRGHEHVLCHPGPRWFRENIRGDEYVYCDTHWDLEQAEVIMGASAECADLSYFDLLMWATPRAPPMRSDAWDHDYARWATIVAKCAEGNHLACLKHIWQWNLCPVGDSAWLRHCAKHGYVDTLDFLYAFDIEWRNRPGELDNGGALTNAIRHQQSAVIQWFQCLPISSSGALRRGWGSPFHALEAAIETNQRDLFDWLVDLLDASIYSGDCAQLLDNLMALEPLPESACRKVAKRVTDHVYQFLRNVF